jgi:tetratricopeptide (TPR) repeat protein
LKRYQEALPCYEQAVSLAPTDVDSWFGKSEAHYWLKQYGEALASIDRVLHLSPTNPHAWKSKAQVLQALGHKAEAKDAERRAKEFARR